MSSEEIPSEEVKELTLEEDAELINNLFDEVAVKIIAAVS